MKHPITLLDGATGTALWAMAAERGIPRVPVWQYSITHPALVAELTAQYAAAGSDIVLANSFCANPPAVERCPGFRAEAVVAAAVALARENGRGAQVALSVGPLERVPRDRAERLAAAGAYDVQMGAGAEAGADLIFLETFWEPTLLTVAAERAAQYGLPLFCSMTFEKTGATFGGVTPTDMVRLLEPYHPDAVGLNCSCGPAASLPVLRDFARHTDLPLIYKPNAGEHTPESFAEAVGPALELAQYAGGCCGTTPTDIAALKRATGGKSRTAQL